MFYEAMGKKIPTMNKISFTEQYILTSVSKNYFEELSNCLFCLFGKVSVQQHYFTTSQAVLHIFCSQV